MGRMISEQEKARRAARRAEAKDRTELGPLYADQAEQVDERQLLITRRMGWAKQVEHAQHIQAAERFLDELHGQTLRSLVAALITPEELAEYDRQRAVAPSSPEYTANHWDGVLRRRFGVVRTIGDCWRKCGVCKRWHAPGQVECYAEPASPAVRLDTKPGEIQI